MGTQEIKAGDYVINSKDKTAKPQLVSVYSKDNDSLGIHQPDGWFKWTPLRSKHIKI